MFRSKLGSWVVIELRSRGARSEKKSLSNISQLKEISSPAFLSSHEFKPHHRPRGHRREQRLALSPDPLHRVGFGRDHRLRGRDLSPPHPGHRNGSGAPGRPRPIESVVRPTLNRKAASPVIAIPPWPKLLRNASGVPVKHRSRSTGRYPTSMLILFCRPGSPSSIPRALASVNAAPKAPRKLSIYAMPKRSRAKR